MQSPANSPYSSPHQPKAWAGLGRTIASHPEQEGVASASQQLQQLRAAFDLISDVVAISNSLTGEVVSVNRAFVHMHGLSQEYVVGRTIQDLNLWVDFEARRNMVRLVLEGHVVRDYAAQVYDRDGKVRDVRINSSVLDVSGTAYIVVTVRDVTEVRRTRRVLRQAQSRMLYLFEHSPVPMAYVFSDDLNTSRYNQAWFATFGFDPQKDQGKSGVELRTWVNHEDRQRSMEMAKNEGETGEMEVPMRYADGSVHWISLRVRLQEESNRTLYLFSYIDVTQRRQAQDQLLAINSQLGNLVHEATQELTERNAVLNKTLDDLRRTQVQLIETEKVAALGTLVAGLSHEINTPIGNSLLMSTALENRLEKFAKQRTTDKSMDPELADFLEHAARVAQTLTRSVTKVSQLVSAFKQVADDQPTDKRCTFTVGTLFDGVDLAVAELSGRAECPVKFEAIDGRDLELDSYPAPMMAVLAQITENAIVHGYQEGKLHGYVLVSARRDVNLLKLEVKDFGIGITRDNLGKVFDPFFTTQLGRTGHGLGLSIVHKLVSRLLGGSIQVFSDGPLKGTRFEIHLPLVAPAMADARQK